MKLTGGTKIRGGVKMSGPVFNLIPLARTIDWSQDIKGVPGGIVNRTTIYKNVVTEGADNTGAADCSALLESLTASCPVDQVLYFPAGVYKLTNIVNFGSKSRVTWRGAGTGVTKIVDGITGFTPIGLINVGLDNPTAAVTVSGTAKGSTSITVADATNFAVGRLICISQTNDHSFVWHPLGTDRILRQVTRITSVSGNVIGINPPLYWDFDPVLDPKAVVYPTVSEFVGFEDLTITHKHPTTDVLGISASSIFGDQTYGLWIKNVESDTAHNRHFYFTNSLRAEIRHCFAHEAQAYGPNAGVGVELYENCAGFLVEDNIFFRCFPSIMMSTGSGGNVFAYNFSDDVQTGSDLLGTDYDCNHGAHTMMNLYEGNIGITFQSDGYFGSASHTTVFRNWFKAVHPTLTQNRKALDLCRWARYFNVVGNILGDGSISPSTWVYDQSVNSYAYTVPVLFRFGYPNLANNFFNETAGQADSRDLEVENTVLLYNNYDFNHLGIVNAVAIRDSYYLSGKPAFFGALAWPPIDPSNPGLTNDVLPAGYRYNHGVDP